MSLNTIFLATFGNGWNISCNSALQPQGFLIHNHASDTQIQVHTRRKRTTRRATEKKTTDKQERLVKGR